MITGRKPKPTQLKLVTSIASLYFRIEGEHDNAGFYALSVGGVEYRRTNATYTAYSLLYTQWSWAAPSVPFGSGTRHTVLIL